MTACPNVVRRPSPAPPATPLADGASAHLAVSAATATDLEGLLQRPQAASLVASNRSLCFRAAGASCPGTLVGEVPALVRFDHASGGVARQFLHQQLQEPGWWQRPWPARVGCGAAGWWCGCRSPCPGLGKGLPPCMAGLWLGSRSRAGRGIGGSGGGGAQPH